MRSRPAFTFAEILLCVYILGVALLGLVVTFTLCLKAQRGGQQRQVAATLAEGLAIEVVTGMHRNADDFHASHRVGPTPSEIEGFTYALDDRTLEADFKRVDVSVYFVDQTVARELTLSELVYNSAP